MSAGGRAPYDRIAREFAAARRRLAPREVEYLAALVSPLRAPGRILDLGCGTGHPIASHLAEQGHALVGVDASSSMLALARERLPQHRWIRAEMETLELRATFDAVVCWDSLFHLPRERHPAVVRRIHRWLAPGGRVMVSSGGIVDGPEGFTDTMFGHEFFYDSLPPREMIGLLEETGFEIVLAEMCDPPDGGRNRGKWATVAERSS